MYNYFVAFVLMREFSPVCHLLCRAIALDLATSVYLWDEWQHLDEAVSWQWWVFFCNVIHVLLLDVAHVVLYEHSLHTSLSRTCGDSSPPSLPVYYYHFVKK